MSYAFESVAQTQAMLGDAEAHDSARLIDDRSEGVLTLAKSGRGAGRTRRY